MDYLNETAKKPLPGDRSSFLDTIAPKEQKDPQKKKKKRPAEETLYGEARP